MMMRAFAETAPEFPDWTLEIYGDGEDRAKLTELAERLNREKGQRIFLRGRTSDVPAAIRSAAVFLLCSEIEGMPNSLLEAMSLGLAVVSTDCPCGGPAEVIRDGENGLLIPVGDTEALGLALLRLMRDEQLRERLGRAAVRIRDTNAPDVAMKSWEIYLAGLAEKNRNQTDL